MANLFQKLGAPVGTHKLNSFCDTVRKDSSSGEMQVSCPAGTSLTSANIWPHTGHNGHVVPGKANDAIYFSNSKYTATNICCK